MRWMGLVLRGKVWYLRRSIPHALRPFAGGRAEVLKSLRSSDEHEARLLSLKADIAIEQYIGALRDRAKRAKGPLPSPTELAALHERLVLKDVDAFDAEHPLRSDDDLESEKDGLQDQREKYLTALEDGDHAVVAKLLNEVLTLHALHLTAGQRPAYEGALLKAEARINERAAKRLKTPDDKPVVTLATLIDAYCRERQLRLKSEVEIRSMWGRFAAHVGEDTPASEVTKADCRAFKTSLLAAKSNRKANKSGTLTTSSLTKILSRIATVCNYAVANGMIEHSPMAGGLSKIVRGNNGGEQMPTRLPYDEADLRALFDCEAFRGLRGVQKFVPILSVAAGLRLEEAASLRVADLKTEDGIPYVDLTVTPERSLKSASSARRVPLHSLILRAGLLDYAATVPQDGRLFPELKKGIHGQYGRVLSKWWRRYAVARRITSPLKTFHSGRHSFRLGCRTAGVSMETANFLMGHATPGIGARYGGPPPVKVLAEAVESLRFPGLELR
jgi:integrase